jgi:hypothetical protein
MTTGPDTVTPPRDYRLLVPRDWFRIDLTRDRWRGQLKTFVDRQAEGKNVTAEAKKQAWAVLRNAAEAGVRTGALELFLRPELADGSVMPASLLVSLVPGSGSLTSEELLSSFHIREQQKGTGAEVTAAVLPAGEAVRIMTPTRMEFYVRMPGGVGSLVLAFGVPVTGMSGPMYRLCLSIAGSLRWVF